MERIRKRRRELARPQADKGLACDARRVVNIFVYGYIYMILYSLFMSIIITIDIKVINIIFSANTYHIFEVFPPKLNANIKCTKNLVYEISLECNRYCIGHTSRHQKCSNLE